MKNLILLFTCVIIIMTFGCNQKVNNKDVSAIMKLTEKWDDAYNTGNADALVSLYTDDAIILSPNQNPVVGSNNIREYYNAEFEYYSNYKISDPVDEIVILGDKAFVRGKFLFTFTIQLSDKQEQDEGNWIMLLNRQPDGSWKFYYEIFNSESPLPGTM